MSLNLITGRLLWYFGYIMILIFHVKVLDCFCILSSNHILHLLLTSFWVRIPYISPHIDSEMFSDFVWIQLLQCFLLPLVAEFLSLCIFSQSYQASCWWIFFCFPEGGSISQVCGFYTVLLSACAPFYQSSLSLSPWEWAQESGCGEEESMGLACGIPVEGSHR